MTLSTLKVAQVAAPLRQQAAENIRGAILSGHFKPGGRLIERELCELLGVSRTAVREALRQLESEGLVENIANKGPVVAKTTHEDAIGIYEVRGAIEALIGELFTQRATDQQVKQLNTIVTRLEKAYDSGDVARILKVKSEFYAKLVEGSKNSTAETILRSILGRANFLRSVSLSQADRWPASKNEIRTIMTAIERRKPGNVASAFKDHVAKAMAAALKVLPDDDGKA